MASKKSKPNEDADNSEKNFDAQKEENIEVPTNEILEGANKTYTTENEPKSSPKNKKSAKASKSASKSSAKKSSKNKGTESNRKPNLGKKINEINNVESHPNEQGVEKGSNRMIIELVSALSYILFFLPLIFCRKEPFALYHANQALILTIIMLVLYLAFAFFPTVRVIALPIIVIFHVIGIFFGMYNSAHGRARAFPIVGKLEIIKWNKK